MGGVTTPIVDRKLLFEPTGQLTQKSGKGQPLNIQRAGLHVLEEKNLFRNVVKLLVANP